MSRPTIEQEVTWGAGEEGNASYSATAEHESVHSRHWETSPWPLVLTIGILFLLPFSYSLYFVYASPLMAMLSLRIGAPLTVISIAGWIKEGAWLRRRRHAIFYSGRGIYFYRLFRRLLDSKIDFIILASGRNT